MMHFLRFLFGLCIYALSICAALVLFLALRVVWIWEKTK